MEKRRTDNETAQSIKNYDAALRQFQKENYDKAVDLFEKAVAGPAREVAARARVYLHVCREKLNPPTLELRTADDHYEYGIIQLNARNLDLALENLSRADKMAAEQDHIKYALAAAHSLSGDVEAALELLEVAITLNPTHALHAKRDEDFRPLDTNSRFQQLIASSGKRA